MKKSILAVFVLAMLSLFMSVAYADNGYCNGGSYCGGGYDDDDNYGRDGVDGRDGIDGTNGTNGTNGYNGSNGRDGMNAYGGYADSQVSKLIATSSAMAMIPHVSHDGSHGDSSHWSIGVGVANVDDYNGFAVGVAKDTGQLALKFTIADTKSSDPIYGAGASWRL